MEILKKISFFLLFFLTLSQGFGNSVSFSEEHFFLVENQDERQSSNKDLFQESGEQDDENCIDSVDLSNYVSEKRILISSESLSFYTLYSCTVWQPPQNS